MTVFCAEQASSATVESQFVGKAHRDGSPGPQVSRRHFVVETCQEVCEAVMWTKQYPITTAYSFMQRLEDEYAARVGRSNREDSGAIVFGIAISQTVRLNIRNFESMDN